MCDFTDALSHDVKYLTQNSRWFPCGPRKTGLVGCNFFTTIWGLRRHAVPYDTHWRENSDSNLYSGVEMRPWTFQWNLTLHLLIWTVSHINRSVHQWKLPCTLECMTWLPQSWITSLPSLWYPDWMWFDGQTAWTRSHYFRGRVKIKEAGRKKQSLKGNPDI